jgi:hypothetical protein
MSPIARDFLCSCGSSFADFLCLSALQSYSSRSSRTRMPSYNDVRERGLSRPRYDPSSSGLSRETEMLEHSCSERTNSAKNAISCRRCVLLYSEKIHRLMACCRLTPCCRRSPARFRVAKRTWPFNATPSNSDLGDYWRTQPNGCNKEGLNRAVAACYSSCDIPMPGRVRTPFESPIT